MAGRRRRHPALEGIDERAGGVPRGTAASLPRTAEILTELRASAERLGRSPTMRSSRRTYRRERAPADRDRAFRHVERGEARGRAAAAALHQPGGLSRSSGSWARSSRCTDRARHRGAPQLDGFEVADLAHVPGSLAAALKEAGFDVPVGEERLERAIADGAVLARRLGRLRDGRLEGRPWARRRCCPNGRSIAWSTCSPARGRRSSSSCASGCARRASCRPGRRAALATRRRGR